MVDVVCRAVPSPGVWKKYIEMETCEHGTMQSIRFRDKALGYQYSTMELVDSQGNIYRGGIESQPWLRMFFSGMIIRPSCTECKFRSRYRNSDFTIFPFLSSTTFYHKRLFIVVFACHPIPPPQNRQDYKVAHVIALVYMS